MNFFLVFSLLSQENNLSMSREQNSLEYNYKNKNCGLVSHSIYMYICTFMSHFTQQDRGNSSYGTENDLLIVKDNIIFSSTTQNAFRMEAKLISYKTTSKNYAYCIAVL